jgi:hypothetical protein
MPAQEFSPDEIVPYKTLEADRFFGGARLVEQSVRSVNFLGNKP